MSGPPIPNKLGAKVTARDQSWMDLAERAWGSEFRAPDHGVYSFSNGRKYDSTDKNQTGIYGVVGDESLLISGSRYPDMRDVHIAGVGYGYVIQEPPTASGREEIEPTQV